MVIKGAVNFVGVRNMFRKTYSNQSQTLFFDNVEVFVGR